MTDEGAIRLMEAMCSNAAGEFTTALKGFEFARRRLPAAKEELKNQCERYIKEQDKMTVLAQKASEANKDYCDAVVAYAEENTPKNKRRVKTLAKRLSNTKDELCKMSDSVTEARKRVDRAVKEYMRTKSTMERNARNMEKEADWFRGKELVDPSLLGIEGDMVVAKLIKEAIKKGIINEESGKDTD